MLFFQRLLSGTLIGIGAILPGISSGVICLSLGIYEELIERILHFFRNIKSNLSFLFPYLLGGIIGCFFISRILIYLFDNIPVQTNSLFIGLLLGSLMNLYNHETNINSSSQIDSSLKFRIFNFFHLFFN